MRIRPVRGDRFLSESMTLAVPIMLQALLVTISPLLDSSLITVTNAGDGGPLAAIGMASQLTWLHGLMQFGFTSGAAVFISQYWGARDLGGIRRTYGLAMTLALGASLVFMALGQGMPGQLMRLFTGDVQAEALGVEYLRVASFAYPAVAVYGVLVVMLRSTEQPRLPLVVSAVGVVASAAFSLYFIYFRRMGVLGAGLSIALAAWISPILLIVLSLFRRNVLIEPPRSLFGWEREFVKHYLSVSAPVLFNEILWAIGIVLCRMVFMADKSFYSALTAYGTIEGVAFAVFSGLCGACSVMVGKSVGMGDVHLARSTARRFAILLPAISALIGVIMIAFRDVVLWPFNDLDPVARETARQIVLVAGLELALRNYPFITIVGIFRAGGDTRFGLVTDIGCVWAISLPVTYFCARVLHLPLIWVYLAMLLAEDGVKVALCVRRFTGGRWIRPITATAKVPDPDTCTNR